MITKWPIIKHPYSIQRSEELNGSRVVRHKALKAEAAFSIFSCGEGSAQRPFSFKRSD
jgi:hypothetical protein